MGKVQGDRQDGERNAPIKRLHVIQWNTGMGEKGGATPELIARARGPVGLLG